MPKQGCEYSMRAISLFRVMAVALALQVASVLVPAVVGTPGIAAHAAGATSGYIVEGNTRVDRDTIISYLKKTPGGTVDIDASVKALFVTNLFSDVKVTRVGGAIKIVVKENPVIMRVLFEGNKRQNDDALKGVVELQSRSALTQARVQSDTQHILELYRRTGRYDAQVTPKVIDRGENRVDLVFQIDEGPRTEINKISFVGNKAFSDGTLKDAISERESNLLSWISNASNYDPDRLSADKEALRRFYLDHGYADVNIVSADANFDRQANAFFVTFTVEEGARYTFGKVSVETTLKDLNADALRGSLKVQEGGTYRATAVEKSVEAVTLAANRAGYAFAQVRPRADKDFTNHTVALSFYVDEGPRAYIERIDVVGNTRTRDFVIRREFDVAEGDAFNQALLDRAQRRLQNLGYFKTVKITTQPGSAPDKVVVVVTVEDQTTGEVSVGGGYSTSNGPIAELSFSQKNFFGRGESFVAKVSKGQYGTGYELAFTEPYMFDNRLAGSFDVYHNTYLYTSDSTHPYDETVTGAVIGVTAPLIDDLSLGTHYTFITQKVDSVQPGYTTVIGTATRDTSAIDYTLVYNTVDNYVNPHDGNYAKLVQQIAGLGGNAKYLKTTVQGDFYRPVYEDADVVGHLSLKAGDIAGFGGPLNYLDQFHLGGETVRGFETNGFGPRDAASGYQLGGQLYVAGTAETIFPFPFIPKDFGMSSALFADAGTLWNTSNYTGSTVQSSSPKLRASIGTSLIWQSPFGLIRADFAWPVVKQSNDNTQVFSISGGTKF